LSPNTLTRDYKLLGLDENASAQEVRTAYHRMKALYADSSLATYSLLTSEQREEMLDSIERAYMRISRELESAPQTREPRHSSADKTTSDSFRQGESVGSYLKRCRQDLGLTHRDIATRTRIRMTYLEQIENENLSELPAPVYLRGFVLEFARALGVPDPEALTAAYLERVREEEE
jgi:ribosome-binding protein aMBF1 (putative translation factor)